MFNAKRQTKSYAHVTMSGTSTPLDNREAMPVNLRADRAVLCPFGTDSGFASTSVSRESSFSSTEQEATVLSRNSSFSSVASSSGGSAFDTDSPVSRSSSWRSNDESTEKSSKEQQERLRAARAKLRNAHRFLRTNQENGPPTAPINFPLQRPSLQTQGRSNSDGSEPRVISKSRLSAPEALVIATPLALPFMQYRSRSRSWNAYVDSPEDGVAALKGHPEKDSKPMKEKGDVARNMDCLHLLQRSFDAFQLERTQVM